MSLRIRRPSLLLGRNQSSLLSKTFIGNVGTGTDLTTYNVLTLAPSAGVRLQEAADRYIVFAVGDGAVTGPNSAISFVTVNGVPATKLVEIIGSSILSSALFVAHVPVGNVFSFHLVHGETQTALNIGAWAVYGINPVATDTDSAAAAGVTSIAISNLTVPTVGLGFAAVFLTNNNTVSWTGVTEDYDVAQTGRHGGGSTSTAGTNTITASFASTTATLVGAAFSASGV